MQEHLMVMGYVSSVNRINHSHEPIMWKCNDCMGIIFNNFIRFSYGVVILRKYVSWNFSSDENTP